MDVMNCKISAFFTEGKTMYLRDSLWHLFLYMCYWRVNNNENYKNGKDEEKYGEDM